MNSATIRKLYRNGVLVGTTVWLTDGENNLRISFDGAGEVANPEAIEEMAETAHVLQVNNIDSFPWAMFAHKVQYGILRIGEVLEIEQSGRLAC